MEPLTFIFICLVSAYLASECCKAVGIPRVVGQIIAGFVLGIPFLRSYIMSPTNLDILAFLAQIGSVLLFFFIGLEINLRRAEQSAKTGLYVSLFNTLIPLALGYGVSHWVFGLSNTVGIVIGLCLGVSSQAIALDLLDELGMLKSKIGQLIITAGAVDDLVELFLVGAVVTMVNSTTAAFSIFTIILDVVVFFVLVALFKFFLVPSMMRCTETKHLEISLFTGSLIIVLLMSVLAEKLGIGGLMGGLFAGILIRQTLLKDQACNEHMVARTVEVISFGFLVPMLFVYIGFTTDLSTIQTNLLFTLLITAIAIGGTVLGTAWAVMLRGWSFEEGELVGWGVSPKGDTELVIAALALQKGIITIPIFSSLVVMAVVTTFIAPIAFRYMARKQLKA